MFPVNESWQAPGAVSETIDLSREQSGEALKLLRENPEEALKVLECSIATLKGARSEDFRPPVLRDPATSGEWGSLLGTENIAR